MRSALLKRNFGGVDSACQKEISKIKADVVVNVVIIRAVVTGLVDVSTSHEGDAAVKGRLLLPSPGAVRSWIQCGEEHEVFDTGQMWSQRGRRGWVVGLVESIQSKFRRLAPSMTPVNALRRARAFRAGVKTSLVHAFACSRAYARRTCEDVE